MTRKGQSPRARGGRPGRQAPPGRPEAEPYWLMARGPDGKAREWTVPFREKEDAVRVAGMFAVTHAESFTGMDVLAAALREAPPGTAVRHEESGYEFWITAEDAGARTGRNFRNEGQALHYVTQVIASLIESSDYDDLFGYEIDLYLTPAQEKRLDGAIGEIARRLRAIGDPNPPDNSQEEQPPGEERQEE